MDSLQVLPRLQLYWSDLKSGQQNFCSIRCNGIKFFEGFILTLGFSYSTFHAILVELCLVKIVMVDVLPTSFPSLNLLEFLLWCIIGRDGCNFLKKHQTCDVVLELWTLVSDGLWKHFLEQYRTFLQMLRWGLQVPQELFRDLFMKVSMMWSQIFSHKYSD